MKVLHTEISTLENRLLHIERIRHPLLLCRFHHQPEYHAHPELELLYVEKGSGTRIINGKEEPFTDGDMVFLGPNVPHIWTVDTTGDAAGREDNNAVLLYLDTARFEKLFRELKEFSAINTLLAWSSRGLYVSGATRVVIAEKLEKLILAEGFDQVQGILSILNDLSESKDLVPISGFPRMPSRSERHDPLLEVLRHIDKHCENDISLTDVSTIASMTPNAFSRFFKQRMKKTFSAYLLEQRMARAQQLLLSTDHTIAEVSTLSGYPSLSHFCKVFKKSVGARPIQFRQGNRPALAQSA